MSDVDRLLALFNSGELIRPSAEVMNIVDMSNALYHICGVDGIELSPSARAIKDMIGEPEHLVLVLVDGFGMNFVKSLDRNSFIPTHLSRVMHTVFPSTTSTVLTSLTTGQWPAQHALTGWHVYLPEIDEVSTIIRFQRAWDKSSLSNMNVNPAHAFPVPSCMGSMSRKVTHVMPEDIVDTPYSRYWSGGLIQSGYKNMAEAIKTLAKQISESPVPTFSYIYTSQLDGMAHEKGASHPDTLEKAREADRYLQMLWENLPNDSRLVMTADHGHLDAQDSEIFSLEADDILLPLLDRKPSGDVRVAYFSVREGKVGEFEKAFLDRFGEQFILLHTKEAEELKLFGPEPLSDETCVRLGNMMSISTGPYALDYRSVIEQDKKSHKRSHHSGLTPDEMQIPLVIA